MCAQHIYITFKKTQARGGLFWRRRSAQTSTAGGDEKEAVKGYFNTVGFERWNKIYGTTDEISSVSALCQFTQHVTSVMMMPGPAGTGACNRGG